MQSSEGLLWISLVGNPHLFIMTWFLCLFGSSFKYNLNLSAISQPGVMVGLIWLFFSFFALFFFFKRGLAVFLD